jgi:RNA polymerase sigma factor (sigma-70 family)
MVSSAIGQDDPSPQKLPSGDALLLEQFAKDGNQQAFATLLDRHGPYLLGVCRRLTSYTHDAEDVFQACCLELARKASTIRNSGSVAGWLQAVAVRMSRRLRIQRARRAVKDAASARPESTSSEDLRWTEVRQILEEEIARLPDALRAPIVLCFFEGQTQEEAAEALRINPRTLKDRLRRGRELLGRRLVRHGVSLAVLGAILSGEGAQAAISAGLAQTALTGATAAANNAPLAGLVSPGAAALVGASSVVSGWGIAAACAGALLVGIAAIVVRDGGFRAKPPLPTSNEQGRSLRTIRRSFGGRQFDAELFKWSGPSPLRYMRREDQGLRMTLPATNGPGEPIGVQLRCPVHGDFELEVTLEVLEIERPEKDYGAGATVYFFLDSAEWDGLWFGKLSDPKEGPVFAVGHRLGKGAARRDKFVRKIPARAESGVARLKVVRRGAMFSVLGAEGTGESFRPLGTFDVGPENLSIVRLAADPAWSASRKIDVRFLDFAMSAEEFVGFQE